MDSPEISNKIKSAIKAKLVELESYVDDELPDYIMVMVANKKTQKQMENDLDIFLHSQTPAFTKWLFSVLEKLEKITKDKKSSDKTSKKEKKKKVKKSAESKEEKATKKEAVLDAAGAPVPDKKKASADKGKKEKKKKSKAKETAATTTTTAPSVVPTQPSSDDKKSDPAKAKISSSSKTQKPEKASKKRSKSPKKNEAAKKKAEIAPTTTEKAVEEVKSVSKAEAGGKERSASKEVRKQRRGSLSSRSRSTSLSSERSFGDGRDRRGRRSPELQRERRRSSPPRGRSRPDRSRSPFRGPERSRSPFRGPGRSRSPMRGPERSRSPVRGSYRGPGPKSPDHRGPHDQRPSVESRLRDLVDRSPDPRRRDDRHAARGQPPAQRESETRRDGRRHSADVGRQQRRSLEDDLPRRQHDDRNRPQRDDQRRSREDQRHGFEDKRHSREDQRVSRDGQRHSRDAVRRFSRSASPEVRGDKVMSSVVAVVKTVRHNNDNGDDEYNPMKMLKTSIASKVEVPRPKSSSSRTGKPVNPASKVLVTRAFQEADSSIKRKKQEELEREAQLEELRRKREEKLSKLRSKGIGVKKDRRNSNSEGPKPDVRLTGSDIIRATGNEDRRRRVPDDLEDDLELEELRSTTNKKNFVIEIKNRVEPSSEDLRVRLDKRRLVVRPNDVNKNDGHRHAHNDDAKRHDDDKRHAHDDDAKRYVDDKRHARNDDDKRRDGHRSAVHRSSPRKEVRDSPPAKVAAVDDKKKMTDDDKDLMEMRRRALESLARGRAQQQAQKKIIVPLNEESSSSSDSGSDSSSDSSSSDSSSDDDDEISLSSTENEAEVKRQPAKEETTFVVTLEGIDASYFRNKARPSQTNSLLKKNKKEDELDSGNKQDRGFEGPITVEQRVNISVPVLAAVGGGSGRSDPKIDDSVYRTSKKPEAKVKPTIKAEKHDQRSPKKTTDSPKKDISARGGEPTSTEPPKKIRKRIEAPTPEKPAPHRPPISRDPVHRPISYSSDYGKPPPAASAAYPSSRLPICKFWPKCVRGSQCSYYHPPAATSSSSNPDKYRWSSANAPA